MNNSKIILNSKKINTSDLKGIENQNINFSEINESDSESDSEFEYEDNQYYNFSSDEKSYKDGETDSESNFSASDTEEVIPLKKKQEKNLLGMKIKKKQTQNFKILQEDNDFEEEK